MAAELTAATITANPDLVGIFDSGGTAYLGIQSALRQAGKLGEIKLIAFDADTTRLGSLLDGDLFAIVGQAIFEEGGLSVKYAVDALNGLEVPKQTVLPTAIVTADNYQDEDIAKYLYSLDCAYG